MVRFEKIFYPAPSLGLVGIICLIFSFSSICSAQKGESEQLPLLFKKLAEEHSLDEKQEVNERIITILQKNLSQPHDFNRSFPKIPFLGKTVSKNDCLVAYSWNYPTGEGDFQYSCIMQFRPKSKGKHRIKVFHTASIHQELAQNTRISPDQWYGALYYRIVTKYYKKKPYYLLLGWNNNTPLMNCKIIEVLDFSPTGDPILGAPNIQIGNKKWHRLIFYYSKQAKMHLDYNVEEDLVVFDHLSPREPKYQDMFQYYGPDFTYDGLKFKKGAWLLVQDLYLKNSK